MKLFIFASILFSIQILLVICHLEPIGYGNPLKGKHAVKGSIWPKPLSRVSGNSSKIYSVKTGNFQIRVATNNVEITCTTLNFAVGHYSQLIRELNSTNGDLISLEIDIIGGCRDGEHPRFEQVTDEQYEIIINEVTNTPSAVLKAATPWGALRGLETFYQMIWSVESEEDEIFYINETLLSDQPRFLHRGIMIDSARHYLPESSIVEILTGMMYNKFNVLHWHLVDDQSFAFESRKFPELSNLGAYNTKAVYGVDAMVRIKEAARARGIRIIFEIDSPGHVGGFGKSHPEFLTPCYGDNKPYRRKRSPKRAGAINFDPSNEQVFEFMEDFLEEVVSLSNDTHLHLGFDEVFIPCWQTSPRIKAFMEKQNYNSTRQVLGYYINRITESVKKLGVKMVAWQDPLTDGIELDKDTIVHFWMDKPGFPGYENALIKGYRVLQSACWYVNDIKYGPTWSQYYECDPITPQLAQYEGQVLGGEAAIWGEFIDQTNVMSTLFPSSSAVAEVLWTARSRKDPTDDAMWRLDQFRCSMLRRGIRAQPILCGYCGDFELNLGF